MKCSGFVFYILSCNESTLHSQLNFLSSLSDLQGLENNDDQVNMLASQKVSRTSFKFYLKFKKELKTK